jgi:hypothetical protein
MIIENSYVTSLNITGKRSEGNYCCHVINRFGEETNCTSVTVTGIYDTIKASMELESMIPIFISYFLLSIKIKSKLQSGLGLLSTTMFLFPTGFFPALGEILEFFKE